MLYQLSYIGKSVAPLSPQPTAPSLRSGFRLRAPVAFAPHATQAPQLTKGVLYQLSYIGEKPSCQLLAFSHRKTLIRDIVGLYSLSLPRSGSITSLRCTQVLPANSARIASVARRILISCRVLHARTPRATNDASAISSRFTRNPFTANGWCTGKDSNLRTSEEGQIYSLLALTTHPPVQNCGTVRPFAVRFGHSSRYSRSLRRWFRRILQKYGFANVKNRNARANAIARKHHTWKIPLWSAVGKSVKPPRPRRISCPNQCWSWRRDLNP